MKIVIMGAGKVGKVLCRDLAEENHEITLIEKDAKTFQTVLNQYDITGVLGNGASYDTQMEAGVNTADMFIALTDNDELNMIASVLAKKLGAVKTGARVRNQDYSDLSDLMRTSLDINLFINPELEAARKCMQLIEFPLADSFESFANNKPPIVELKVSAGSNLGGKSLIDFRSSYKNLIVCCVMKNGEIIIPKGNFIIEANDHLFVTGPMSELVKLYKDNGQQESKIRSLFIIGGGLLAQYVIKLFEKSNVTIKVLELNHDKAKLLSRQFPKIEVIEADGTDINNLREQGAANYDAVLALTGIDEENIIISMIAKSLGVKKTLTKINRTEVIDIVEPIGLQSVITPKRIVSDTILQYVRAFFNSQGSNVEALYTIAHDQVEALQFRVKEGSKATLKPLRELKIKKDVLIAYIYRKNQTIFPTGNDRLMPHDRVIVISYNGYLSDLDEIVL
ncbi:Trk system potassium transporter TrkA [Lachnospiraceae bacterium oral taxon 500]|nr:Trk system potassium transporter TrkA [Lachnospiraceae bacterium oral taxon 500]